MLAAATIVDGNPVARNLVRHRHCPSMRLVSAAPSPGEPEAPPHQESAEETSQHALLTHGVADYGTQLLQCGSRDELEEKLDELVSDSAFLHYMTYLQEKSQREVAGLGGKVFKDVYTGLTHGRCPAKTQELAELAFLGCRAIACSSPFMRMPKCRHASMSERLDDLTTPVEYTIAILSGMRASACELALIAGWTGDSSSLSDEQLADILDVALRNQRDWLRLVAGLPHAEIQESIVPHDARIEWDALVDRWNTLCDQVARYERAASESRDGAVYPFANSRGRD